jgi:endonuclease/exonuclease/phosphatase family metal-dependent hydrolase
MRVMTYNIHGWLTAANAPNVEAVIETIRRAEPDIVGLNEVYYPRRVDEDAPNHRATHVDLPADLPALAAVAAALNMEYLFGPCRRWPAHEDMPPNAYGNALLSKYPVLAGASHLLTAVEGKEQRGLLEGRVQLPGTDPFTVYVTHLDHTDEAVRLTQLRALRTWTVRDRNRPHIVMGDFNAISPWDFEGRDDALAALIQHEHGGHMADNPQVVAQMEKAGYTDAHRSFGARGEQSFIPAQDPPIRIDYIFVSAPLLPALVDAAIVVGPPGAEASDHRPVTADFDLAQLEPHER